MYKPYPKYRSSRIEWLEKVPEHWDVKRMRYLFRFQSGGTPDTRHVEFWEGTLPWISAKDMRSLVIEDSEDHISADAVGASATSVVPASSLLILTRSGILRHSLPVAITAQDVAINQDVKGCVPVAGVDPLFVAYLITGNQTQLLTLWRQQGATVESLDFESIKATDIPLPPLSEQRAIADFLDAQTAKFDALVSNNRILIEKLKEKRNALISRTVTRGLPPHAARAAGLDPHPRLKPSGIEWLGDVPEHWGIVAVRRRARRVQTGTTPPTAEVRYYDDGTIPWYGPSSFEDEIVLTKPVKMLHEWAVREGAARLFAAGATLVVTIGATAGKIASLSKPGSCNQQITAIEWDSHHVHPRFATYQLKRLEMSLRAVAPSATLPILKQAEIANIALALPEQSEQKLISAYLDRETTKIDRLIAKIESAIDRLHEYRTALITAAVTGKIDVRETAA